jgi:hypothetical protein
MAVEHDHIATTIWKHYARACCEHGMPDQLVMDRGTENVLVHFVQHAVWATRAGQYEPTRRAPARATLSVHNVRIERLWVEVNARVVQPLRTLANRLQGARVFDVHEPSHLAAFLHFAFPWVEQALQYFVESRNNAPVRSHAGGVPNVRAQRYARPASLHKPYPRNLCDMETCRRLYEEHTNGQLPDVPRQPRKHHDPLTPFPVLRAVRDTALAQQYPQATLERDIHTTHSPMFCAAYLAYLEYSDFLLSSPEWPLDWVSQQLLLGAYIHVVGTLPIA